MKYKYFIAYFCEGERSRQYWGNCEVCRNSPMSSCKDVNAVEVEIAKSAGYKSVKIMNWQRFEEAA